MNVTCLPALRAALAQPSRTENRIAASCPPANSVSSRYATSPTWMGLAGGELRLPLGHAPIATERLVSVEVALGPHDILATPITSARLAVHTIGIWTANLRFLSALPRALALASLASSRGRTPTDRACARRWFTPSRSSRAGSRTESRSGTTVERVEFGGAMLARMCLAELSHIGIIPLEEKWCEVAAKRLSQEVLAL